MIAYGAEVPLNGSAPKAFDLPTGAFILYVSRLEPENNPELVIGAYRQVQTEWPLVMVGGNSYDASYVQRLQNLADRRVIFLGPVYGSGYWELLRGAGLYVFACEVGGVHPALIEAMAAQKPVLYLDTPENHETAGDAAIPFRTETSDLAAKMSQLLGDPQSRSELALKAQERAARLFGWEETTQKYEALFSELLPTKAPPPSGK
jgi:glycosyltransferase involved in cell wall biosynthesis